MINDYAEAKSNNEFDVLNRDVRYTFRVTKKDDIGAVVANINCLIKKHYEL